MSDEDDVAEKRLKIVLVGDSGCGKTSIAVKFCTGEYTRQYTATSGIDFNMKNVNVGRLRNVNLYLWDVGGLALHGTMLDKYLFGAHIILLVFDVTNSSSFDVLEQWLADIRQITDSLQEWPVMALIGNKCDMEHQRAVKREKSHYFAAEHGFSYHDMSARTGESVSLCIVNLAAHVLGVRLTKMDQDYHKPIVTAEIGDTVDVSTIQKVVKRAPNKKSSQLNLHANLPHSKSSVCLLQ